MFVFLISQALCAWFAFLLPSYATFKALSHQPAAQPELQRWTVYWTVLGAFLALEHIAEWLVSWFPFYWEIKTIFLLFLALPQTEGSTYIYNAYLQPFLVKNEADLDAGIVTAQTNAIAFVQSRLAILWDAILGLLNKTPASGQPSSATNGAPHSPPAPALSLDAVMNLWKSHSPALLGSLQSISKPSVASDRIPTPGAQSFATASATSLQTPSNINRRVSTGSDTSLPNPYAGSSPATTPSAVPPPFPEPQFH